MASKEETLAEIKKLHQSLLKELAKVTSKMDAFSQRKLAASRDKEQEAMAKILDKIKKEL